MATTCRADDQYYALPSRRIAQVVRRFDERYQNGSLTSICRNDYGAALQQIVDRIQSRLTGRCLPRPIETQPATCEPGSGQQSCVRTRCVVRELLPMGTNAATACTAARGRTASERDGVTGRDTCLVREVALPPGGAPPAGREGYYYDTRPEPQSDCRQHIEFTAGAQPMQGATAVVECIQQTNDPGEFPAQICQ